MSSGRSLVILAGVGVLLVLFAVVFLNQQVPTCLGRPIPPGQPPMCGRILCNNTPPIAEIDCADPEHDSLALAPEMRD